MSDERDLEILQRARAVANDLQACEDESRLQKMEAILTLIERAVAEGDDRLVLSLDETLQELEGGVAPASRRRGTSSKRSGGTITPTRIHVVSDQMVAHCT